MATAFSEILALGEAMIEFKGLPLSVREWTCTACGTTHDRDINAAVNLKNNAVSSTVSVCGEEGAGRCRKTAAKPASKRQKPDSKFFR